MKVVSRSKRIELSREFDASTKMRLWLLFNEQHEKFVSLRRTSIGRDSFLEFTANLISDFQDKTVDATIYDPTSEDATLNIAEITSRTLYNFLGNDQSGVLRTHPKTLRYVEAFLAVALGSSIFDFRRSTFLETLGAATAGQYASPKRQYSEEWTHEFFSDSRLYLYRASSSVVPGPLQSRNILIYTLPIPNEQFLIFRAAPIPFELETSRFNAVERDLSDWLEDQYVGIGALTRDGLSCHLTSANAKIPLYMLIRQSAAAGVEFAFVSYETPGYLLPYATAEVINRPDVKQIFDNQPWIV
jgi:hypothetical protein